MYLYTEANKQINSLKEEIQLKDKNLLTAQNKINEFEIYSNNQKNKDDFSFSQNDSLDLVYNSSNKAKEQILYENLVAYSKKSANYYISLDDLNKIKSPLQNRINELEKEKFSLESELLDLKSQNEKINSQKLASTELCKTLDENYQQLKSAFEKYKSEMTESIKQTIKQSSTIIQKLKEEKTKLDETNINLKMKNEKLEKELKERNKQIEEIKTLKQKYEIHNKINQKIVEKIITELKKKNDVLDQKVTNYSGLLHVSENGEAEVLNTPLSTKSFSYTSPLQSPYSNNKSFDSFQMSPIRPTDNNNENINYSIVNYNCINSLFNPDEINIEDYPKIKNMINDLKQQVHDLESYKTEIAEEVNRVGRGLSESISFGSFSEDNRSMSLSSPIPFKLLEEYRGDVISFYYDNSNNEVMKLTEEFNKLQSIFNSNNSMDNSLESSMNISEIREENEMVLLGIKTYGIVTLKYESQYNKSPKKMKKEEYIKQLLKRQTINKMKKEEEKSKSDDKSDVDPTICQLCGNKKSKETICHCCKKKFCFDCCRNHVQIPGKNYKRFVCNLCNINLTKV